METTTSKPIERMTFMNLLKSRVDPFGAITRAPQRNAEIMEFKIPGRSAYLIHQPEMVQHILQQNYANYKKDEGYNILALLLGNGLITNNDNDNWKKHRKLLQPPFHRESLAKMCSIVVDSTEKLLQQWKAKEGSVINFTNEMANLTIDIVSRTLFSSDVNKEQIQMVWRNLNYLNLMASNMARNPWHIPWHYPMPRYVKARKYIAELNNLIYGIIHKRRQEGSPNSDLLQILIDARYDDGSAMTDEQIRDEVMTVFVAGHETTVNALSWTWYLLKKHTASEQQLHEESKKFATTNPAFADVPTLRYGWCVMNEAMRVYPPVTVIGRKLTTNDEVCGYQLQAGHSAVINIAGLHYHPAYWDNPTAFTPERFMNFDIKGSNRFVFMPFGAGPRICIGNNFAMMEMQLINAMLSARVDMQLVSTYIKPIPLITLKPGDGVMVKLQNVQA